MRRRFMSHAGAEIPSCTRVCMECVQYYYGVGSAQELWRERERLVLISTASVCVRMPPSSQENNERVYACTTAAVLCALLPRLIALTRPRLSHHLSHFFCILRADSRNLSLFRNFTAALCSSSSSSRGARAASFCVHIKAARTAAAAAAMATAPINHRP